MVVVVTTNCDLHCTVRVVHLLQHLVITRYGGETSSPTYGYYTVMNIFFKTLLLHYLDDDDDDDDDNAAVTSIMSRCNFSVL